ncbi:hypothetical protein DFP72DRAFT_73248 [Ephemerocybe angulata]|uniref:Uncharacterized protein n=1 Tax=Ephemerocybe angulata TaxID=980116 RepID=A0A8H6I7Q9_9AGAR|nr:hypothetical protein DFP72DRAFT_73248 [Tulosesus angulatus]
MEPLRDLSSITDWDHFTPSVEGYIPPSNLDVDVWELLECLDDLQGGGTIANLFVSSDTTNPGVVFKNKMVSLPLTELDAKAFAKNGVMVDNRVYELDVQKFSCSNPRWESVARAGVDSALAKTRPVSHTASLTSITAVIASGAQSLDLHPVQKSHYATVLVILPSQRTSTTLHISHGNQGLALKLTETAPFSMHFIALYTGTESALLVSPGDSILYLKYQVFKKDKFVPSPCLADATGARPEIATVFAAWRSSLSAGVKVNDSIPDHIIYQLDGTYANGVDAIGITHPKDKLVLGHFAPPAKHFGFEILLAHVTFTESSSWEHYRDYKEYDEEYDVDDYEVGDHGEISLDVECLLTALDGNGVNDDQLADTISKVIEDEDLIFNDHLRESDEGEKDLQITDQSCYTDTLKLECVKLATYLVIVPV